MKNNTILKVNEIFKSIQGESTYSGLPCIFIRLTYCNLRCAYCDTEYAFHDGKDMSIGEILDHIKPMKTKLVEVTGGEPMLQDNTIPLMRELLEKNYNVLLETSGAISLKDVPSEVKKIVDFKCPSSAMSDRNLWSIIDELNDKDEVKFVIGDQQDYQWTKSKINEYNLNQKWTVLLSPVFGKIPLEKLAEWILEDNLDVRLQLQMHKYIWDPDKQGV
jgi:7-carboxy-7-deazaguanine synthase